MGEEVWWGWGCISRSDSHTRTLKTLLDSTHRDEKRDDGSSGAGWENVGSMKSPGRPGRSAQSAQFLHLRGVTVELGVVGHGLKKTNTDQNPLCSPRHGTVCGRLHGRTILVPPSIRGQASSYW